MAAAVAFTGCPDEPVSDVESPGGDFVPPPPGGAGPGAPPAGDAGAPAGDAAAGAPGPEGAAPGGEAGAPAAGEGLAGGPPPEGAAPGSGDATAAGAPAGDAPAAGAPASSGPGAGGPNRLAPQGLPKDVYTQEALKSAGNAIKVKGVLLGDVCKGKKIRIDALQKGSGVPPIKLSTFSLVSDIGQYELLVPKSSSQVWIMASCDVNGDGQIMPGVDLSTAYAKNPITPNSDLSGVVMTLSKDPVTEGMPPGPDGNSAAKASQAAPKATDAAAPAGAAPAAPGAAPKPGAAAETGAKPQ